MRRLPTMMSKASGSMRSARAIASRKSTRDASAGALTSRLDARAGPWIEHRRHIESLFNIIERCLEPRRRRRAEMIELIEELENIRAATVALQQEVPQQFCCPITGDVMQDPVSTADGHTYGRAAIERWLSNHNSSPLTGSELPHTELTPVHALRQLIEEWAVRNGDK